MGRRRALTDDQVNEIFGSPEVSSKEFATRFGVSYVTVLKVRQGKGAYTPTTEPLVGQLVLNEEGQTTYVPLVNTSVQEG